VATSESRKISEKSLDRQVHHPEDGSGWWNVSEKSLDRNPCHPELLGVVV
jgi:hypothetical protein